MKKTLLKQAFIWLALMSMSTSAFAIQANTDLILSKISQDWKNVVISVDIDNPSNQNISSVQSWLEFDEDKLDCKKINTDDSAFDFVVPWESNISWNIIKIWRSSLSWDVADSKINVVKINCEILKDWWEIRFHDYQTDWWKVSVMVFENWFPVNTLKWEPESLKFETPKVEVKKVDSWVNLKVVPDYIERPVWLKIDTAIWSATLAWDKVEWAEKYYIYYWKTSWRYLQRRLVPNNEIYKLDWLETWSQYYFAITAVWNNDLESDYSNEEAVIIWKKITSTSPLLEKNKVEKINNSNIWNKRNQENIYKNNVYKNNNVIKNNYLNNKIQNKKIAKNVQTWPTETAFLALFIALAMWAFIYRKKYI